ncbi:MAG TPA: CRISPR-associated endoribonuclease Cas6 [Spirochaetota bacterium]|nr:CRISPR-associated endoribonuclease Cas6 [Spirochaetota bacterium]
MRVEISFGTIEKPPIHSIQSFIYQCLHEEDKEYATFIHKEGIKHKWKSIKPFIFSHPYIKKDNKCYIKVSSLDSFFNYNFFSGLNKIMFKKNNAIIKPESIRIINIPKIKYDSNGNTQQNMFFISPLLVKSNSGYIKDPDDEKFLQILKKNLIDKYLAINKKECTNDTFSIFLKDKTPKLKIYKKEELPVFLSKFVLISSKELFNIAYYLGLGCKNALGFGMIEFDREDL